MNQRNPFDPRGGMTPMVEQMLNNAYDTVRAVAMKLAIIQYIAANMEHIDRVLTNMGSVINVSKHTTEIVELSRITQEIKGVYTIRAGLVTIAGRMNELVEIHSKLTELMAIYGQLPKLVELYNNLSKLIEIHSNLDQLIALEGSLTEVLAVHAALPEIQAVPGQVQEVQDAVVLAEQHRDAAEGFKDDAEAAASLLTPQVLEFDIAVGAADKEIGINITTTTAFLIESLITVGTATKGQYTYKTHGFGADRIFATPVDGVEGTPDFTVAQGDGSHTIKVSNNTAGIVKVTMHVWKKLPVTGTTVVGV